jgi:hypothetical protein
MSSAECKAKLVEAHRRGDQEAMRALSQMREKLKRRRYCEHQNCGVRISRNARYCFAHTNRHPQHKRKLT